MTAKWNSKFITDRKEWEFFFHLKVEGLLVYNMSKPREKTFIIGI